MQTRDIRRSISKMSAGSGRQGLVCIIERSLWKYQMSCSGSELGPILNMTVWSADCAVFTDD
jgi:hypothetical protein